MLLLLTSFYFKPSSSVSIIEFERLNVSWALWMFSSNTVWVSGVYWCSFSKNITILLWLKHLINIKCISSKYVKALPLKLLSFQTKAFMYNRHSSFLVLYKKNSITLVLYLSQFTSIDLKPNSFFPSKYLNNVILEMPLINFLQTIFSSHLLNFSFRFVK